MGKIEIKAEIIETTDDYAIASSVVTTKMIVLFQCRHMASLLDNLLTLTDCCDLASVARVARFSAEFINRLGDFDNVKQHEIVKSVNSSR